MTNAELIEALRCCIVDFNSTQSRRCNECPYRIYADGKKACENKAKRDAADALGAADKRIAELESNNPIVESVLVDKLNQRIAELEAQMPKEGEWKKILLNGDGTSDYKCSACLGIIMDVPDDDEHPLCSYCPNCGARMKG